jgi:exonuclease III
MSISIASWNVETFNLDTTLKDKVVEHVKSQNPDIFAILEVVGADVWRYMFKEFPKHSFYITEGKQNQEILVGVHKDLRCFLTQRDEFKSGRTTLRPGPFLTVQVDDEYYTILFLHVKSISDPVGFGLRDDMIEHAFNLKKSLDKVPEAKGNAKFLFMGDLNTMGMNLTYLKDVKESEEIDRLEKRANRRGMTLLQKDYNQTWTKNGLYSDLDHVVASNSIKFKTWNGNNVKVLGWNQYTQGSAKFDEFVNRISDHCSIYCEIELN